MAQRGKPPVWIGPAREVLLEKHQPCHSEDIRNGVAALQGDERAEKLAGGTLYASMLSSSVFVRVAGRPSVFGLSEWYLPHEVVAWVNAYLANPRDTNLPTFGIPREPAPVIHTNSVDCMQLKAEVQKLVGLLGAATPLQLAALDELYEDSVNALLNLIGQASAECGGLGALEREVVLAAARVWPDYVSTSSEAAEPTRPPSLPQREEADVETRLQRLEERDRLRQKESGADAKGMIAELAAANAIELQQTKDALTSEFRSDLEQSKREQDQAVQETRKAMDTMQLVVASSVTVTAHEAAKTATDKAIEDSKRSWITWLVVGVLIAFLIGVAAGIAGNAVTEILKASG